MVVLHYTNSGSRLKPFFITKYHSGWLQHNGFLFPHHIQLNLSHTWQQAFYSWLRDRSFCELYICSQHSANQVLKPAQCCSTQKDSESVPWHFPLIVNDEEHAELSLLSHRKMHYCDRSSCKVWSFELPLYVFMSTFQCVPFQEFLLIVIYESSFHSALSHGAQHWIVSRFHWQQLNSARQIMTHSGFSNRQ